jgi:hypothetical protein
MCGPDSAGHVHLLSANGQPARELSSRPLECSCPNIATCPRRTERYKVLCLACWNANGVRGRKLELEHFLNPDQAFRLANYVCQCTDRLAAGDDSAIQGSRGIVHHSVPVPSLTHLEANAIQVILTDKPVQIITPYLSPSRPLIRADLTACFDGELPVLLTCDLNAKFMNWISRLNTRRGKLLRDYADENSRLIFGPDTPTTNPHTPPSTPHV